MKKIIDYIQKNDYIKLLLLIIISSLPIILIKNLLPIDDTIFHTTRINLITEEIKFGNIFSKMYRGYLYGFGYGSGLFYPDLFLYIPSLLHYFGINIISSYKIFIILINTFSIFSMYYVVKKISKNNNTALIASIIYAFSSYRLTDIYLRGALGETLAFIFVPIVIYGIYLIIYGDYKKIYVLIFGMTGLIYSHLVTSYMIVIMLFIICLLNTRVFIDNKKRLIYLLLSTFITLLLTSYFLLPLIEQLIDRKFFIYNSGIIGAIDTRSVPFFQSIVALNYDNKIWIPSGIGLIFLIIIILKIWEKKILNLKFENILFFIGVFTLIMATNIFPWKYLNKIFGVIQFPWRFYLITTVFLTISGSIVINKKIKFRFGYLIILGIMMLSLYSIGSSYIFNNTKAINNEEVEKINYNIGLADYFPKEIDYIKINELLKSDNNYNIIRKDDYLIIEYNNDNNYLDYIEVPYIYYLGYVAECNNKLLEVVKTNRGLVGVNVSNIDKCKVKVYYKHTKITNLSFVLTIVGLIILCMYIYSYKGGKYGFIRRKRIKTKDIKSSKTRSRKKQ